MYQLVNEAPFMSTTELETVVSLCYRALDGSNYDARYAVAELLGNLSATALNPKPNITSGKKTLFSQPHVRSISYHQLVIKQ